MHKKLMILRWVGVVMPEGHIQMPLLTEQDLDNDSEEVGTEGYVMDKYPF